MNAFDVIGDPVRRRLVELLASGEQPAGALVAVIAREFGISQPAVSAHLRVLRESGFASVRPQGARRLYAVQPAALAEVDAWTQRVRRMWEPRLDALGREVEGGASLPAAAPVLAGRSG